MSSGKRRASAGPGARHWVRGACAHCRQGCARAATRRGSNKARTNPKCHNYAHGRVVARMRTHSGRASWRGCGSTPCTRSSNTFSPWQGTAMPTPRARCGALAYARAHARPAARCSTVAARHRPTRTHGALACRRCARTAHHGQVKAARAPVRHTRARARRTSLSSPPRRRLRRARAVWRRASLACRSTSRARATGGGRARRNAAPFGARARLPRGEVRTQSKGAAERGFRPAAPRVRPRGARAAAQPSTAARSSRARGRGTGGTQNATGGTQDAERRRILLARCDGMT